jgi:hypothetical protein
LVLDYAAQDHNIVVLSPDTQNKKINHLIYRYEGDQNNAPLEKTIYLEFKNKHYSPLMDAELATDLKRQLINETQAGRPDPNIR